MLVHNVIIMIKALNCFAKIIMHCSLSMFQLQFRLRWDILPQRLLIFSLNSHSASLFIKTKIHFQSGTETKVNFMQEKRGANMLEILDCETISKRKAK